MSDINWLALFAFVMLTGMMIVCQWQMLRVAKTAAEQIMYLIMGLLCAFAAMLIAGKI